MRSTILYLPKRTELDDQNLLSSFSFAIFFLKSAQMEIIITTTNTTLETTAMITVLDVLLSFPAKKGEKKI